MTNNVARARTAEPQHRCGDLLGLACATDRNVLRDVFIGLLVTVDDIAGDLRIDQSGIHRVHADSFSDVFQSGRPRQAHHAMLRSYIGGDSRVAGQCADRRIIDDGAAALTFHVPEFVLHATPHAAQIDSDYTVPVFTRAVCGRGDVGHDARIVKRCVYSAELGNGAVHHRRDLRVVTDVTANGDRLVTGGD